MKHNRTKRRRRGLFPSLCFVRIKRARVFCLDCPNKQVVWRNLVRSEATYLRSWWMEGERRPSVSFSRNCRWVSPLPAALTTHYYVTLRTCWSGSRKNSHVLCFMLSPPPKCGFAVAHRKFHTFVYASWEADLVVFLIVWLDPWVMQQETLWFVIFWKRLGRCSRVLSLPRPH